MGGGIVAIVGFEGNLDELAYAHIRDLAESELLERAAHGFALRV